DTWYLTFYVDEEIRVLSVNGSLPNARLDAAFSGTTHYTLTNQSAGQVDFSAMRGYDLVILNQLNEMTTGMTEALYQYLDVYGGKVLMFPAPGRPVDAYNGFLSRTQASLFSEYQEQERTVGYINTDEFIFKDVFVETRNNLRLPVTQGNYRTTDIQLSGREKILGY